ncbi:MAG: hypothetical protein EAZ09_17045 [Oscillatoriales cyanobacterium]|nr:MAG: hypothetical protein EAZ18_16255 [Oscillatoriales cyanobacterium]TAH19069.1 MAG: hypothetical protein EAZ09_17045 [Oscillatoriales cyanobacterium]
MTEVAAISAQVAALLVHYGFDLGGKKAEKLAGEWLTKYPSHWLRLAVIEALYQGRYKAVSVGQILNMWQRLSQPLYHFNGEFERLVCNNFYQDLTFESDFQQSQDERVSPSPESNFLGPELDLLPSPEVEVDRVKDTDFPKVDSEEIAKFSTIDRTNEDAEVVIYEDLAVTEVADRAEADRTKVDQVEKSTLMIKHTDFHSKLKAVASEGIRKKGERRKKV